MDESCGQTASASSSADAAASSGARSARAIARTSTTSYTFVWTSNGSEASSWTPAPASMLIQERMLWSPTASSYPYCLPKSMAVAIRS